MKLGSLKVRKQTLELFLEKYDGMDLTDLNNISELNSIAQLKYKCYYKRCNNL